jgi:hypothetical protein
LILFEFDDLPAMFQDHVAQVDAMVDAAQLR